MQFPQVGQFFEAKYEIVDILGEGGFARVFHARDMEIGRDVAIKMLTPQGPGYKPEVVQRFMREARVIAELQHPSTITMFEFGRAEGGLLYMVFEFVAGRDLGDVLEERGSLPPDVVVHILKQLLGALVEAHHRQVVHRDIKPDNIIVFEYMDDPYRVKLIDFGIAKPLVERSGEPRTLTRDGMVIGTPRYMAPEQFFGEELTGATDVYSLGLVAVEMLTGEPLNGGNSQAEVMKSAVSPDPWPIPEHLASVELRAFLATMLQRIVSKRFPNSAAALSALERLGKQPRPAAHGPGNRLAPRAAAAPTHREGRPQPRRDQSVHTIDATPDAGGFWLKTAAVGLVILALAGVVAVLLDDEPAPTPAQPELSKVLTKKTEAERAARDSEIVVTSISDERDVGTSEPELTAATGCGKAVRGGQDISLHTYVGMNRRTWTVYVPVGYEPDRRHPAVLLFHRGSRWGVDPLGTTKFRELANEHQFVVLAIDAANVTSPWKSSTDVEATRQAVEETSEQLCLDPRWLFAVGNGSGGRFAAQLPCQMSLSAVAVHGFGQYEGEQLCLPKGGVVPLLRSWGKEDPDVPAAGGPGCMGGRPFMTAEEHRQFWKTRHQCRGSEEVWLRERGGQCSSWSCDVAFASCAVKGGHAWPGSQPPAFVLPGCEGPTTDFPLGDAIWRFFTEQGRSLAAEQGGSTEPEE